MSATGECFDIGMATRTALIMWRDYFFFIENSGREEEEGKEKKDGLLDVAAGQVLIDNALKHEVCRFPPLFPLTPPPSGKAEFF